MGWVWEERVAIHARDLCILLIFIATQILVDLAFCMSKFTPFLLSLFLSLFFFSFGEISKTPIADIFSDKCPSVDSRSPKVCLYLGLLKDSNSSGCVLRSRPVDLPGLEVNDGRGAEGSLKVLIVV